MPRAHLTVYHFKKPFHCQFLAYRWCKRSTTINLILPINTQRRAVDFVWLVRMWSILIAFTSCCTWRCFSLHRMSCANACLFGMHHHWHFHYHCIVHRITVSKGYCLDIVYCGLFLFCYCRLVFGCIVNIIQSILSIIFVLTHNL